MQRDKDLLCLWDKETIEILDSFINNGYVGVEGEWKKKKKEDSEVYE